jgi:hypothetical protein
VQCTARIGLFPRSGVDSVAAGNRSFADFRLILLAGRLL